METVSRTGRSQTRLSMCLYASVDGTRRVRGSAPHCRELGEPPRVVVPATVPGTCSRNAPASIAITTVSPEG